MRSGAPRAPTCSTRTAAPTSGGRVVITNTGDRPVQIGSHVHLPAGQRGAGLRPGRGRRVPARRPVGHVPALRAGCVAVGGDRRAAGPARGPRDPGARPMVEISREAYAAIYGPTTGDQVRLGDTDLWIEVEDDLTFGGEEAVFGGGKSIRESMAQSAVPRVRRCARHRHHQRGRARPLGRRPRRRRPARRPHRGARARRQPRHRRRRAPGPRDRPGHRRDLRRGQDPHRRGDRRPRAPALARRRSSRPSPPGPPPSAAAAPARPRARRRPRSPRAPGTSGPSTGRWTSSPSTSC